MEIFLILLLAIFIVPLCYLKGIKKGIDSVTWDLYINKKLSEEDTYIIPLLLNKFIIDLLSK